MIESEYFSTHLGRAFLGDSLELLPHLPSQSVDLICTSPPFALLRKKAYGNVHADDYIEWFMQFAHEFRRVLKPQGSLFVDIGGTWVKGVPVRSLYHFELVLRLCKPVEEGGAGFLLAQEMYWYNPAKLPTPAEWVTVRRERVKDAVNTVWWLCLDPHPKANNRGVLKEYSESQVKLMEQGYKPMRRPSEHDISDKFGRNNKGAIPPNLIVDDADPQAGRVGGAVLTTSESYSSVNGDVEQPSLADDWLHESSYGFLPVNVIAASNTSSNDQYLRLCREHDIPPHPARFPRALPEFAIGLCTEEEDVVLDPFAGSNMTGYVAETMNRRWIALEQNEEYLRGAALRFAGSISSGVENVQKLDIALTVDTPGEQPSLFE
ncbi:MAG: site-specific DNA-methyltransferase [Caldilinea sp.]|nr:site-specific DNA-methyltransferase [Caldilinea sp.]MCB0146954.1 site-specific DNA-methyltransferase [Caldilineaceae bacterium]MCO5210712.1 site-specific DNA-methyltransferase [Caldilinea sp.]MCW5843420.1 site-specific DNA-methyltransferase [Caldilinea sp.]HRW47900.1 site-specific DNA-methyltransferase [Caldilinea sp.]